MVETNLVKTVREERVPGHINRGRPEKSWDEVVKEDMKKNCASIMPKTETSGDDAAEEWSTLVNWEEDLAIKAKWKRNRKPHSKRKTTGIHIFG